MSQKFLFRHVAPFIWRRSYASKNNPTRNAARNATRKPSKTPAPPPPPRELKPSTTAAPASRPKPPSSPPPKPPPSPARPIYDASKPMTPRTRTIRNMGAVIAAFMAAGIGLTAVQLYPTLATPCADPTIAAVGAQRDVVDVYDRTADTFDASVAAQEWLSGLTRRRKELAGRCRGHVLEVSCGTGRNIGYFDLRGDHARVESLTFVDVCAPMVQVCRKKGDAIDGAAEEGKGFRKGLSVRFLAASALGELPLAKDGDGEVKYTTILQTMGLCSTAEPVELVVNMARHLDVEDPDARIYLLEHGRSYMPLWNRVLDNSARKHAEIHGCWYNREIGDIVEEAAQRSGMEIAHEKRYSWGTVWMYELKPKPGAAKILEADTERRRRMQSENEQPRSTGWLSSIRSWL